MIKIIIMFISFYFGIIIVASIAVVGTRGQEACSTNLGDQSICISITKCSPYLDLLKSQFLSDGDKELLKKSQCGFDGTTPKVCCPVEAQVKTTTDSNQPLEIPVPPNVKNHRNVGLINPDVCGPVTETRIILGNKTRVLEYPWMVLIGYNLTGSNTTQFACGGSLITKRFVLTAAHCVTELDNGVELSTVRLGEHNLRKEIDCDYENGIEIVCADKYRDFLIQNYLTHEKFLKKTHRNDIALVKLNGDADFTFSNVKPICLPVADSMTLKSRRVIVTGWGTTEKGIRSQELLMVKLDIGEKKDCVEVYKTNYGVDIDYKQICAGGKDRRDSCAGDSGGPLQYPGLINDVPKYVQYGIVNFGTENCGVIGYPGVYLNIAYYMDWILDNIDA